MRTIDKRWENRYFVLESKVFKHAARADAKPEEFIQIPIRNIAKFKLEVRNPWLCCICSNGV